MKNNIYIKQFFYDGFGRYLFDYPTSYLNKKIKNKEMVNFLTIIIGLLYCGLMAILAKIIFDLNYPF